MRFEFSQDIGSQLVEWPDRRGDRNTC
ncbi:hypothetical protein EN929_15360, partial [Mesorhizobium sp. M7A.F.Ca.CA.004.11.1.1]